MRVRNIRLAVILVILLIANIYMLVKEPEMSKLGFDPDMFSIVDTTQIESIKIDGPKGLLNLIRQEQWAVDNNHYTDPNILNLFFAVMNRITVTRELGEMELKQLENSDSLFYNVSLQLADNSKLNFQVTGNLNATKTFFITDDSDKNRRGYEVEIQGYRDYVGGIFQLDADQWKDRLVFNGNWRSIQRLDFDYTSGENDDFTILFKDQFFGIEGLIEIDSNAVIDYLNEFEYLQANERISFGKFARFDSLAKTIPSVLMTIDDIKFQNPEFLKIYPLLPGANLRLIVDSRDEMLVFQENRIRKLFKKKADFRYRFP